MRVVATLRSTRHQGLGSSSSPFFQHLAAIRILISLDITRTIGFPAAIVANVVTVATARRTGPVRLLLLLPRFVAALAGLLLPITFLLTLLVALALAPLTLLSLLALLLALLTLLIRLPVVLSHLILSS